MVVRRTKLQLIFYARDGLFAAVSQAVHTLLMSCACRPQLTLEMLVVGVFFFNALTLLFLSYGFCCIVIITELLLKMD